MVVLMLKARWRIPPCAYAEVKQPHIWKENRIRRGLKERVERGIVRM